jgi:anti-sigma regulatory factor (Ser/Thr protein kinase)
LPSRALKSAHAELERSNAELEQFAYVASHDLQEPLRMVSSYTQLLGKRYGEKLEGDAKEFMAFIVDGAGRMKQLIEDLLAYSRVGTRGKDFKPVRLEAVMVRARANLRGALEESGATLTHDPLPEAEGDESQLVQLVQNLIGNAIKFRGSGAPSVHVSCVARDADVAVAVQDNGIGIDPQYFERIFMVFQRLHDKGQYPGTGIGLAICRKVVDRHGGRIWVESAPGEAAASSRCLGKRGQVNLARAYAGLREQRGFLCPPVGAGFQQGPMRKLKPCFPGIGHLAACGGRSYEAAVSPAPTATVVAPAVAMVQTAPAVIYPGGIAVVPPAGVVVETVAPLRPGFGRVTAIQPVYYTSGAPAGTQRLTLAMSDGSVQVVDTRGPNIAIGAEVEITSERNIRYPVASNRRY